MAYPIILNLELNLAADAVLLISKAVSKKLSESNI